MPHQHKATLAVTAAATTLMLAVPAPSVAQSETRQDRAGDAPAAIDVRDVVYTYRAGKVTVRAEIPELGNRGEASLSISQFAVFEAGHVLRVLKRPGQSAEVGLAYFDHFSLQPRRCKEMRGVWGQDVIRMRVATSCLGDDAVPRIFIQFGISADDEIDRAPAVRRLAAD